MTFKFEVELTGASQDEHDYQDEAGKSSGFIRSKKDNQLLPELQIKNIKDYVTEDCVNYIDADSIPFMTASSVEDDYIEVLNNITGDVAEYKNITEFKGNLRTEGAIKADSKLGIINIKREAKGEAPFVLKDFTITPKKRLKHEKGCVIDGVEFKDSFEVCKYYIDQWIDAIKIQTQVPNVVVVTGSGLTHRHDLLLPHQYKSNRNEVRPLLLKQAREYMMSAYPSELAQQREEGVSRGLEADEVVDAHGFEGYVHFRKHGKFNKIKSSLDKDSHNLPSICFDYTKSFHFDNPHPWLIEHRDVSVGKIELIKDKVKGVGLLHAAMQIILEDSADEYGSRKYLPNNMKGGISYGPVAFYKDFINLTTAKDILTKVVDIFYNWFPNGLQYTAWDGSEVDEDTLSWLNKCFLCQYMRLKKDDNTQITNWLDQYGIDYSKIVGNNKPKLVPLVSDELLRSSLAEYSSTVESVMSLLSDKSGKVADKSARLEEALKMLGDIKNFDKLYEA
jgi:hypothetical protein